MSRESIDIDYLRRHHLIIFECISGSKAYGTEVPESDTDIKGVFVLPKDLFYGLEYVEQVNDATHDVVFYELKRFVDLLVKNNPNLLELLNVPPECVLYKHPVFELIRLEDFLSKRCQHTFAGYAQAQIHRARGLNKKILKPMAPEKKSILDFCYVTHGQGALPVMAWLTRHGLTPAQCGLVRIAHMPHVYGLYVDRDGSCGYAGLVRGEQSTEVCLSSVLPGEQPAAHLSFNKDSYSIYCRDYKEYWEWVAHRNEARYLNTLTHGKHYDAKNMMHMYRLLDMAEEIAVHKQVNTRRPNRDLLLRIRRGALAYDELLQQAEEKIQRMEHLFNASTLPDAPDPAFADRLLVHMRRLLYGEPLPDTTAAVRNAANTSDLA